MKYNVTVIPKRPAHDDRGFVYEIEADSKIQAISKARRQMGVDSHYDRFSGPLVYKAVEIS